jgi:hypothetical protein
VTCGQTRRHPRTLSSSTKCQPLAGACAASKPWNPRSSTSHRRPARQSRQRPGSSPKCSPTSKSPNPNPTKGLARTRKCTNPPMLKPLAARRGRIRPAVPAAP